MRKTVQLVLISAILAVAGGCASTKLDEGDGAKIEQRGEGTKPEDASASGAGSGSRTVTPVEVPTQRDELNTNPALAKRSIYFDFDSFVIKDEFRPTVEAHARYLVANKGRRVVLQGNTDERGSREYNLALGQKRAEAVRRSLSSLGVTESQMEAVSFGEEKPQSSGTDEAAWAQNRRTDLSYQ